jgi:hypothetical protein
VLCMQMCGCVVQATVRLLCTSAVLFAWPVWHPHSHRTGFCPTPVPRMMRGLASDSGSCHSTCRNISAPQHQDPHIGVQDTPAPPPYSQLQLTLYNLHHYHHNRDCIYYATRTAFTKQTTV